MRVSRGCSCPRTVASLVHATVSCCSYGALSDQSQKTSATDGMTYLCFTTQWLRMIPSGT